MHNLSVVWLVVNQRLDNSKSFIYLKVKVCRRQDLIQVKINNRKNSTLVQQQSNLNKLSFLLLDLISRNTKDKWRSF